jgi:hypothetical protein
MINGFQRHLATDCLIPCARATFCFTSAVHFQHIFCFVDSLTIGITVATLKGKNDAEALLQWSVTTPFANTEDQHGN